MEKGVRKFDVIVIGSGSGMAIADAALSHGKKVAIIEDGPLGGTCLNRGCIPSKMLIHVADVMESINSASKFSITSAKARADFGKIVSKVSRVIDDDSKSIEAGIREEKDFTLYKETARFVGPRLIDVGRETITADKIFIVAGTRPSIPKISGLEKVPYLTSTEALRLKKQPKSMIIMGGGYIAAELAHFFGSLGTKITIVEMTDKLLGAEDDEISEKFTELFSKKYNILLGHKAVGASKKAKKIFLEIQNIKNSRIKKISADSLLVAVGRMPNSDILDVGKSGIAVNEKGYIKVNEFLETNVAGIWALGDIAGIYLFKHSANLEANYAAHNAFSSESKTPVDYRAMPHAVFSSPQIAGVGLTEKQAKDKGLNYVSGKYYYSHTGMGAAMQEKDGFVKAIVEKGTGKILGCHIIGPDASTLIHEVIVAMRFEGTVNEIIHSVHIHPALSEVVSRAFAAIDYN